MKPFIASLALLFCMTSATLCAPEDMAVPTAEAAKVVLVAPTSARIGELVRLDVSDSSADSFKWILVPESHMDWLTYDEGARAVFSARTAGEYRFIVAAAKGGTVDVVTHVVRVIGPPDMPQTDDLSEWIPFWNWSSELPTEEAEMLAASFEGIAARQDELKTPEDWIKATAEANRKVLGDRISAWAPMLDKIGAELAKKAEFGALTTPEEHARVWREIARGLRNC
jgi:hypothetical protein